MIEAEFSCLTCHAKSNQFTRGSFFSPFPIFSLSSLLPPGANVVALHLELALIQEVFCELANADWFPVLVGVQSPLGFE